MSYPAAGGCHCGNVRYTLNSDVPVSSWTARFCDCSFCIRQGGLYASHPTASLTVGVEKPERLGRYRFATASADFCFCLTCGVFVYITSEIDGQLFGLVNMNSLDERPQEFAQAPVMSFEEEQPEERLQRRRKNWIAKVQIC